MELALKSRVLRVVAGFMLGLFFPLFGCQQFGQLVSKATVASKKDASEENRKGASGEEQPSDANAYQPADHISGERFRGASHDLEPDERAGGHTLRKHVGRTDNELRERLAHEDISAASTFTDRSAAEFAVGNALLENSNRIEQWKARSNHPNLALDYRGTQPIGRTLHRQDDASKPCDNAKVVLRWLSSSEFYVLTSYPECP
jgi:hypothetical protein